MPDNDLFERAGGLEGIALLVDDFYGRVLRDPLLAPFFEHSRMERLRRMQTEFFSAALGGPMVYEGPSLGEVHSGRGIEKAHLQRFLEHLIGSLKSLELSENEVNEIYNRIAVWADEITGGSAEDG